MSEVKPCYLCGIAYGEHERSGIPVCTLCDNMHLKPERERRKKKAQKSKEKAAPKRRETKKDEEELVFDLDWDAGELDTQPGWGGFLGLGPPKVK